MCVYDCWAYDPHPEFGEICHVSLIHYQPDGSIGAYSLQEYPLPHPYRFGALYKGPGGRLCPTFIEVETQEEENSNVTAEELMDELSTIPSPHLFGIS